MLFWGCIGQVGHYLWQDETRNYPHSLLCTAVTKLDGAFVPSQGDHDSLVHIGSAFGTDEDWTILAFTDYSVDRRGASNGMFLELGTLSRNAMIRRAGIDFPNILKRVRPGWSTAAQLMLKDVGNGR